MTDRVRAKFYVAESRRQAYAGSKGEYGGVIILRAASRGAQNAQWASATPSGTIELTVNNPSGFAALESHLGDECYVDLDFRVAQPDDGHSFVPSPEGHYNHPNCAECSLPKDRHPEGGSSPTS